MCSTSTRAQWRLPWTAGRTTRTVGQCGPHGRPHHGEAPIHLTTIFSLRLDLLTTICSSMLSVQYEQQHGRITNFCDNCRFWWCTRCMCCTEGLSGNKVRTLRNPVSFGFLIKSSTLNVKPKEDYDASHALLHGHQDLFGAAFGALACAAKMDTALQSHPHRHPA
jgi:hypothetical protein